jgi:hypothetical protein
MSHPIFLFLSAKSGETLLGNPTDAVEQEARKRPEEDRSSE